MGVEIQEAETGTLAGVAVVGLNAVGKSAGLPHDGHGAVAHGDHLAQAARLKARGHEENVRSGVHPAGKRLGKADLGAEPAGVPGLQRAVVVLIRPVARAEHGDLRAGEHFLRHGVEKIEALLLRQTADAHAKGDFTIDGEAELLLQRLLVRRFAVGVGIVVHERLVLRGIVGNGVDAV